MSRPVPHDGSRSARAVRSVCPPRRSSRRADPRRWRLRPVSRAVATATSAARMSTVRPTPATARVSDQPPSDPPPARRGRASRHKPSRPVPARPARPSSLARAERRAIDREHGEPLAAGKRPHALTRMPPRGARPLSEWDPRPRILVTNDDGIESRGLLALKKALEPIGDTYVVAPETNQSAVGHSKTFMRPLRVRERLLDDGSVGWSVDGSPTDAVSLAFLGYFDVGFDLVASGINYGDEPRRRRDLLRARSARRWRRSCPTVRRSRSPRSSSTSPTSRSLGSSRRWPRGTSSSRASTPASC